MLAMSHHSCCGECCQSVHKGAPCCMPQLYSLPQTCPEFHWLQHFSRCIMVYLTSIEQKTRHN